MCKTKINGFIWEGEKVFLLILFSNKLLFIKFKLFIADLLPKRISIYVAGLREFNGSGNVIISENNDNELHLFLRLLCEIGGV